MWTGSLSQGETGVLHAVTRSKACEIEGMEVSASPVPLRPPSVVRVSYQLCRKIEGTRLGPRVPGRLSREKRRCR